MSAMLKIFSILCCVIFVSCGGGAPEENNEIPDENVPAEDYDPSDTDTAAEKTGEETDKDGDTALSDEDSVENDGDTTDDDGDFEELQTGGIYIFSDFDESGNAKSRNILGNGGFLGFSIFSLGEKYWAVSAIHESIPAFDWDKATGRLYIFEKGKRVESLDDSAFVLNHPDKSLNVGFGYTAAAPCDINGDGFDDLAVSSHLASSGDLYAAGEFVIFYGSSNGWNEETYSISRLSAEYIQKADSMSQSLACLDYDGDGFADIFAGGQNAGPDLPGGGSQGMVAFFKGSASGLSENESRVMLPEVEEKAQYFGSSMLVDDLNGDDLPDLVVAGWGLKKNESSANSGGVYIYLGGTDWQMQASTKIFGTADSQFGSAVKVIETGGKKYLAVLASKEEKYGTVRFYDPAENFAEAGVFSFPPTFNAEDGSISDFDTIKISADTDLFVAGGKNFGSGGSIYCSTVKNKTVSSPETCRFRPESPAGGFGNSVFNNKNGEIVVGMPEYIHKF
ncbi:VCBS repeat-containing protein [bacterium]|nr:VCBS repeat-containing protein [bacterium]